MSLSKFVTAGIIAVLLASSVGAQEASYHYSGDLRLSPDTGRLALDWTLNVHEDALTEVSFLLNVALEAEISGPDVLSVESKISEGFGGPIRRYTIALAPSEAGADRQISMRYAGQLFPDPLDVPINTLDADKIELTVDSFWMPFDERFNALITAELDVWLPGDWQGVATQSISRTAGGFRIEQASPTLDLAFTLMSDFELTQAPGYAIYDTRDPAGTNLDALTDSLDHCTRYLNGLAGHAGPLPEARIVVTRRNSGGYSRGTLIALTDIAETEAAPLTQFICHELGHYWSYGNAMTVENWLNESFADYVAIMGMRDALGEDVFEARLARYRQQLEDGPSTLPPVWTPQTTARPPYLVAYRQGPLVLAEMEASIGRVSFARFMRRYMQSTVRTTPQMLDVFEAEAGAGARAQFESLLAD
jgi:hypothetical protein